MLSDLKHESDLCSLQYQRVGIFREFVSQKGKGFGATQIVSNQILIEYSMHAKHVKTLSLNLNSWRVRWIWRHRKEKRAGRCQRVEDY